MLKRRKTKKSDKRYWIDKLDQVFSLYIRMRDSREFGYRAFRCISCGDVKPFEQMDCGHFVSRNAMAIRWNEQNCNGECASCLTPDALILMEDLTWKPLGEVQVMDKIFAFEEYKSVGPARHWKLGTVTHIHREVRDVYEVKLANGDKMKTTADHKWLARVRMGSSYDWVETQNLWVDGVNIKGNHKTGPRSERITSTVCKPILVIHKDNSADAGWMAGMIDADGSVCQQTIYDPDGSLRYGFRVSVAQCEKYPDIAKKIRTLLEKFTDNRKPCRQNMQKWIDADKRGLRRNYTMYQYMITGTNIEKIMFLQKVRPLKTRKVDIDKLGQIRSRYDTKVKSVKYIGKQEIVVMETDTHTFIANGYAMHNCNRFHGDHLLGYRKNLIIKLGTDAIQKSAFANSLEGGKRLAIIKRLGEERVEALEAQKHAMKKWDIEELQQMYMYYSALVLKMKGE